MSTLRFTTHGNAATSLRIDNYAETFIRQDPRIRAEDANTFAFLDVNYPNATTQVYIDNVLQSGNAYAIAAAINAVFIKANSGPGGSAVIFDPSTNKLKAQGSDGTIYYFNPDSSVTSDVQNYFDRMTAASSSLVTQEQNAYAGLIGRSKSKNYFSRLLDLKLYWGGPGGALLNTLGTNFTQIWHNITYGRFATHGSGTSGSYAQTGFIPAVHAPGYNITFGSWGFNNSNALTVVEMGVVDGSKEAWLAPQISGSLYMNCFSAPTQVSVTIADPSGLVSVTRVSQTDLRVFRGGTQLGNSTVSEAQTAPNREFYNWGRNDNGTLTAPSPYSHKMDYIAVGMTPQNIADFNTDLIQFFSEAG